MELIIKDFSKHEYFKTDLSKVVELKGDNGKGKTSILEALVVGIWGRDLYGGIGVSRFIRKGCSEAVVVLNIDGKEIKRVIESNGTTLYLNGDKVAQGVIDLEFGTWDLALPIINPFYLLGLGNAELRKLAMRLTKSVDRKAIFIEKYGEELFDMFSVLDLGTAKKKLAELKEQKLSQQSKLQIRSEELSVYKREIVLYKGHLLEGLPDGIDLDKSFERIDALRRKNKELNSFRDEVEDLKQSYKELNVKAKEYKTRAKKDTLEAVVDLLNIEIGKSDALLMDNSRNVGALEVELKLMQDISKEGKCGTCGSVIDSKIGEEKTTGINLALSALKEGRIGVDGKRLKLTELKNTVSLLDRQMKEIASRVQTYDVDEHEAIRKELSELEEIFRGSDLDALKLHRESEVLIKDRTSALADLELDIASTEKLIVSTDKQIEDYKVLVAALGPKGVDSEALKQKTVALSSGLSEYLTDIRISTSEENKTTEGWKEVFYIYHKELELRNLSWGERIRVAVALGAVFRKLSNFKLPVLLLDESSILGKKFYRQVARWCRDGGIVLISTRLHDGEFRADIREYKEVLSVEVTSPVTGVTL